MRGTRRILLAVLVLLVVGGAAVWWYFLRDTSSPKLTLKSDDPSATTTTGAPVTLAGTWTVAPGAGDQKTTAGYRVQEKFAAGVAKVNATGRTSGVTGSVTVADKRVSAAHFDVDMTTLESDKAQRDNQIRTRGLETTKFTKATFVLTAPLQLPATITPGQLFTLNATGNLTLHGVTKPVTLPLKAKESGSAFIIQGELPIVMADYSIQPPSIGGFVSVDDHGSLEFLVDLTKSA